MSTYAQWDSSIIDASLVHMFTGKITGNTNRTSGKQEKLNSCLKWRYKMSRCSFWLRSMNDLMIYKIAQTSLEIYDLLSPQFIIHCLCTCRASVPSTSFWHVNYWLHQQLCTFFKFSWIPHLVQLSRVFCIMPLYATSLYMFKLALRPALGGDSVFA